MPVNSLLHYYSTNGYHKRHALLELTID